MRKQTSSFISLLLAILMCISLLPVGALADGEASTEPEEIVEEMPAETEEVAEDEAFIEAASDELEAVAAPAVAASDSDFVIEDGVLVEYTGAGGDVVIPDGVTSIGMGAFLDCDSITSVTIPDSVKSIGDEAFVSCDNLASVTILGSDTSIGHAAFADCESLTSVTIPSSITSIGGWAFHGTPWLAGLGEFAVVNGILIAYNGDGGVVTIPRSVKSIGGWAFHGCSSLTSVTIPSSVTSIGYSAFDFCTNLTSVTIPSSVTDIDYWAFSSCENLTSVTLPNSIKTIEDGVFMDCRSLSSVTLPDSITTIKSGAFMDCTALTSVTIPSSVTTIETTAFRACEKLNSVTFMGNAPVIKEVDTGLIGSDSVFYYVTATVYYPAGNSTWTNEVKNEIGYGANLTWVAYGGILTSEDNSVTVENSDGEAWGSGVTLVVNPVTGDILSDAAMESKGIVKYTAYDITLMKDGVEIQPDGSVRVKIALPAGYDGTKCAVYHMDADGSLEKISCTYKDGWLIFTTEHFSTYIVAEEAAATTPDQGGAGNHKTAPQTGDESSIALWLSVFALCAVGAVMTVGRKKKTEK